MRGKPTRITRTGEGRHLLVVVNARASTAEEPHWLLEDLEASLRAAGAEPEAVVTRSEAELAAALAHADGRRVVLVGGDGSVHAAVNALDELPELALIPAGRANNIARALGIPGRVADAAEVAATADARPIDLLHVDSGESSMYCVEALSAGLQADARARYDGENSGDLRAGARSLAAALRRYRPYEVHLSADGAPAYHGEAAQVFLSNLPFFGFGFRVDPLANPADGLLEAIVLEAESRVEAVGMLLSAYRGRHLRGTHSTVVRAHEAEVEHPLPLTCDGVPLGVGQASVAVEQGKLRLAAPWQR
jgi:diacylglycerol kinase family enzyme